MARSYIGKRGYILIKEHWTDKILEQCRNDCNIQPFCLSNFGESRVKFPIYRECNNKLYLPKFYGIEKFGLPDEIRIPPGDDIKLIFTGRLREHQIEPVDVVMKSLYNKGGGILSLWCGSGKTTLACCIISNLHKKTFVLVHKDFLMNQWIDRITTFLPGARIGKIQGTIVDINDKDIVIGMVQSIALKEYPIGTFDSFGFLILDEAHRVPSKEFSRSFTKIQCPYMLALSATPTRIDGLTKVLKWFVGDIIYEKKSKITTNAVVRCISFKSDNPKYKNEIVGYLGKINYAAMINQLVNYIPRIRAIATVLVQLVREENRQVLVLSDRKELLKDLDAIMCKENISSGLYIGGMKQEQLTLSGSKSVILATYPMAAEGLDIATIDTICLATPKTRIEQASGRIRVQTMDSVDMRKSPLIIDWIDDFSIFTSQARQRMLFYKKKGYRVENRIWDELDGLQEEESIKPGEIKGVQALTAMYTDDDLL